MSTFTKSNKTKAEGKRQPLKGDPGTNGTTGTLESRTPRTHGRKAGTPKKLPEADYLARGNFRMETNL